MNNGAKLCMSCMNEVPAGAAACPTCGFNGTQKNPEYCLPIGYRLNNRYIIGAHKLHDGDCVTYVGYDLSLNMPVEVREFLPKGAVTRTKPECTVQPRPEAQLRYKTSLMDFAELFKTLSRITGVTGLLKTTDFFEANGTAYAVHEVFDGVTLREFLSLKGGRLSYEQAMLLLSPVMEALKAMHGANLIHRGVSPETIYINRRGFVKLGGFATSSVRTKDTELTGKLFSGYTAPEQYSATAFQSFSADVYALAAVLYRALTGTVPQDAEQRLNYDTLEDADDLVSDLPAYAVRAVRMGLIPQPEERIQSVLEFEKMLRDEHLSTRVRAQQEEDADEEEPLREYKPRIKKERRPAKKETAKLADEPADADEESAEEEDAEEEEGGMSALTIVTIAAASLFLVMLIVFCVWKFAYGGVPLGSEPVGTTISQQTELTVPDYVGQRVSEAQLDTVHFKIVIEAAYDSEQEEGVIVDQSPAAGTPAKDGDSLILYVNKGTLVTMPDVTGKYYLNAQSILDDLGIEYEVTEQETTAYASGTVTDQSVAAGEQVNTKTRIVQLTVAKAPAEQQ